MIYLELVVRLVARINIVKIFLTSILKHTTVVRVSCWERIVKILLEVVDESDGCGGKFSVLIVSEKFQGKPLLARHRLVNSVLQEELKTIHAFTQKTLTVDQWKLQNQ